jgi:hypothetical protein
MDSDELMIGDIDLDRPAPYRIDLGSRVIGWAPASSVRPRGTRRIREGLVVLVRDPNAHFVLGADSDTE